MADSLSEISTISQDDTKISNSYYLYDIDSLNITYNKYQTGTKITEEELKSEEFFNTLNVDGVWIHKDSEYPELKHPPIYARVTTELNIKNKAKQFYITTTVRAIDGVKGGTISGENFSPYETVSYDKDSTKEIKITPDADYKISQITINGKKYDFEANSDGTYIMPQFKNMQEDKNVVVAFAKEYDQTFTINKVDKDTNEHLSGAEFTIAPKTIDITNGLSRANQYYFSNNSETGQYISNNASMNNNYAYSLIQLTSSIYPTKGKYYIEIDARISSEKEKDIGYATISKNYSTSSHGDGNYILEFMNISGEVGSTTYKSDIIDYDGSTSWYLNVVYSKDSANSEGEDALIINSIKLCPAESEKITEITDENGKINLKLSEGDYTIAETKAPEGYILNPEPIEFNFSSSGEHEITIENTKKPKINVNHYLWTTSEGITTTKLAKSEEYMGKIDEKYSTLPKIDIEYEIITNRDYFGAKTEQEILATYGKNSLEEMGYNSLEDFYKDYYIPQNSSGTYKNEIQTVNYYYKEKTYTLTVKHLLEGTEERVPNKAGGIVEDEVTTGYKKFVDDTTTPDSKYTTTKSSDIDYEKYELISKSDNWKGTITKDTEVRYYYRQKEHIITTKVKEHNETNFLGETIKVKGGEISGEEESPYERVQYGEDSVKDIKAIPDENYIVKKITVNGSNIEFTANEDGTVTLNKFINMTEDKEVIVEFGKVQGTVIIHHYIEGTTNPIDLKDGTKATDEIKKGNLGDIYASKPNENAGSKYKVVNETPEKASGTYINGTIEVTYYYTVRKISVKVNKEWNDNNDRLGIRPTSVKINLKASIENDSSEKEDVTESAIPSNIEKQVTLNERDWTYTWQNLDEYTSDSKKITYSVEEEKLEGNLGVVYSSKVTKDTTDPYKFTITNTYAESTEKVNYVVNKIWDDNSNENNKRPEKLVLNIYKVTGSNSKTLAATYTLNTLSETSYIFELDRYDEKGNEINYIAEEKEKTEGDLYFYSQSGGERQEITVNDKKAYKSEFTNKFNVPDEKVNVEITKEWSDNNNSKEKRPESIKLVVYNAANKVEEYILNTPSNSNTFSHTFENLPKYDEHGNEIEYLVDEEEINANDLKFYSKEIRETTKNRYKITNTYVSPNEKIEIKASKIWIEQNDIQKQRRPSSVILQLMNGNTQVNTGVANEENGWEVKFTNVPKYDNNDDLINYTLEEKEVKEKDLKFYTKTGGENLTKIDDTHYNLTLTNIFETPNDTIDLKTTKIWNDENGKDRLNAIKFVLTGNGQTYEKELSSSNEDKTNSNNWIYTFTDLPKYNENGEEIAYKLTEEEVTPKDLEKYITNINEYSIENKLLIKETKIKKTGTKVIKDLDETVKYKITYEAKVDSNYTENCKVTLTDILPYEIDTSKTYNLNEGLYNENNKTIIWEENCIPKEGKIEITKEISLVYKDLPLNIETLSNTVNGVLQITNGVEDRVESKFSTELNFKKDITVTKQWRGDTSNISGRPKNIVIELLKDGKIEKLETLDSSNNWKTTFKGLEKYNELTREKIEYTVKEKNVPKGYYVEIKSNEEANNTQITVINNKYGTLKITKTDKIDNSRKLGGAEFTLTKLKNENGKWIEDSTYSKKVITSEEKEIGTAKIDELEYGKYRLKETKAPEGYELLKSSKDIEIDEYNPNIQVDIQNKQKGLLPATGAYTKLIIALIGVMLLVIANKVRAKNKKKRG